jgi:hypothetical protein
MTELSPQAQAVWDAYERVDCDPYEIDPRKAGLSAALEAFADQVVPEPPMLVEGGRTYEEAWTATVHDAIRTELLTIAAELRGTTTTTEAP